MNTRPLLCKLVATSCVSVVILSVGAVPAGALEASSVSAGSSSIDDPLLDPIAIPERSSVEHLYPSTSSEVVSDGADVSASQPNMDAADYGPAPKLIATRHVEDNSYEIDVWSPASGKVITNLLLLPVGGLDNTTPRPTLYLLSGAEGGEGTQNWRESSTYEQFFADKNVQVVTPIGGRGSMYADWQNTDPALGVNQWQTYLGEELPEVMASNFYANSRGAIAGLSMSGGPAIRLAGLYPQRFCAAASLSGYPANSGVLGRIFTSVLIQTKGGDPANAFGPDQDPAWFELDPANNLEDLRGIKVFVGTGLGIPTLADLGGQWFGPMWLEILSQMFSNYFTRKAEAAGIEVERYYTIFGAHNYTNFEQELRAAWHSTLGPALGE